MAKKRKKKLKRRNPLVKIMRELMRPRIKPSAKNWKRRQRNDSRGVE